MKKFEEITNIEERNEIVLLFANWLKDYTHEVIVKVIAQRDEIINNDFSMNLLKELKEREETETKDFNHSIGMLMLEFDDFKKFDVHNHPTTHSDSYRNVLHDMYIK